MDMHRVWVGAILGLAVGAMGQAPESVKARLDAIVKVQTEASDRYHKACVAAKTAEAQQAAVDRYHVDVHKNTEDALELVKANPNDPVVVEALKFVIKTARAGPGDESDRAIEILLKDHVRDPGMGDLCGWLFYFFHTPDVESLLRAVMETHPYRSDRGLACHALVTHLRYKAKMARRLQMRPEEIQDFVTTRGRASLDRFVKETDPEKLDKEAESVLERTIAEFSDVRHPLDKRTLGEIAEGELFAMRHLEVGRVAPEIAGKDHAGASFALSEYRGKVVVLTFSGNWCGPCVGMYPQERELVARLKDKPFAMVSVNTDSTVETLKKAIDKSEITWRCWWDGGVEGPITSRWGVSSFPTIFVLDKAGVIRFKDVRRAELDKAVESLL
jgi:peroxiredoxin